MKKQKFTLSMLFLILFFGIGFQLSAQNYVFTIHQDTVLMHCDIKDSTNVYLTLSDPNNELTGPFTVNWEVNRLPQLETGFFTTDSLHLNDTIICEVFDSTMTSVWLDSTLIYDEGKPNFMIYAGYQIASHACYGSGRTKLQVPKGYIMSNVWIDDPNAQLSDGNHVIIDGISGGTHTFSYYINNCKYNEELVINTKPKPDLEIEQIGLASECDMNGQLSFMISDSTVIDSLWEETIADTILYKYVPAGNNDFTIYAGTCIWNSTFYVESEEQNVLNILNSESPIHADFQDGYVLIGSEKGIVEAYSIHNQTDTLYFTFTEKGFEGITEILFENLYCGNYEFFLKGSRECWNNIDVVLEKPRNDYLTFSNNAFSPNGDGRNDLIKVILPEGSQIKMEIYPYRSNNTTLTYTGNTTFWNGKDVNGNIAANGWYVMYIDVILPDGKKIKKIQTIKLNAN